MQCTQCTTTYIQADPAFTTHNSTQVCLGDATRRGGTHLRGPASGSRWPLRQVSIKIQKEKTVTEKGYTYSQTRDPSVTDPSTRQGGRPITYKTKIFCYKAKNMAMSPNWVLKAKSDRLTDWLSVIIWHDTAFLEPGIALRYGLDDQGFSENIYNTSLLSHMPSQNL
jgi:hypothetical protein